MTSSSPQPKFTGKQGQSLAFECNQNRPHSSMGDLTPVEFAGAASGTSEKG